MKLRIEIVTRKKRAEVDHGIRKIGGVKNFLVVDFVGSECISLRLHVRLQGPNFQMNVKITVDLIRFWQL